MHNPKSIKLPNWSFFVLAFLIPFLFALYTNHAWEDWYITYRASKNLALGHGLVYTVGERVHSFTSPLGTLIPAILNFVTGNISDDLVLWLFRVMNCLLLGITSIMLLKIAHYLKLGWEAKAILLGMFILDAKIIDFSINGMETALVIFFLTMTIYTHIIPLKRSNIIRGLAWGGLMWSRPDSFIYIFALCLGFLIFNPSLPVKQTRIQLIKSYCISGLITTIIYLPWLIWAWSYYGSFIPHTVIAKGLTKGNFSLLKLLAFPINGLRSQSTLALTFLPTNVRFGGWPDFLNIFSRSVAWCCAFAWIVPRLSPLTRALSLALLIGHLYLRFGMSVIFAWYIPSVTLISIVVLSFLIQSIINTIKDKIQKPNLLSKSKINLKNLPRLFVIGSLLVYLSLTLCSAYQMRIQQMLVETGNRKQIGLWLHENAASPNDRVFLECLGYIGFYSNLKMYDFPGLSSPEVVEARRKLQTNDYADLINYLRPEWVVLRPWEAESINTKNPALLSQIYTPVKTFDVSDQIASYSFLPGRGYLEFDRSFTVFRLQELKNKVNI